MASTTSCLLTNLRDLVLGLREVFLNTNRLATASDRLLVVILDFGIDDKCRPDQLLPGIEEPNREDDVDSGLLALSRAGNDHAAALRLAGLVVLDVRQAVLEPCLDFLDRGLFISFLS